MCSRKYSYPERLKQIGIASLRDRRLRGDMIEVYKLLAGKEKINYEQFFALAEKHYSLRQDWIQGNFSLPREL